MPNQYNAAIASVACPTCHAPRGHKCRAMRKTVVGQTCVKPHADRIDAANTHRALVREKALPTRPSDEPKPKAPTAEEQAAHRAALERDWRDRKW